MLSVFKAARWPIFTARIGLFAATINLLFGDLAAVK